MTQLERQLFDMLAEVLNVTELNMDDMEPETIEVIKQASEALALAEGRMKMSRQTFVYDGKGINGPDEYRSRIATFINDDAAQQYGKLFENACNAHEAMVEALRDAERILDGPIADLLTGDSMSDTGAYDLLNIIRNAIALAEGKVQA